jgi:signal transduction histidine kinase
LLENLLDWARVQLKKFEFYPRDIKLHNLVNEIFGLYHVIANYKGIQLKNEVEPSSNLFTDIDMLKTILRNLVSNSVKYCVQGDSIVISCKEVEGSSIISITDSGSGIDTAILTQLNNSLSGGTKSESKDKSSGTGLGLVLVKDLLKIMKGSYEINSEKGRGTEIIIEIPTLLS